MANYCIRRFRRWYWLAFVLVTLPVVSLAQTTGVGFQSITIRDPVNGGTMPGYVFYPSTHATGTTRVGLHKLHATRDISAIPGAKPLVVLSHGHGGSDLELHQLAIYLASHGFITATLQHPRDNYLDKSGAGGPTVLIGRPIQVKATISMLLADPHWKALIDPNEIGVAGFSLGGYTALVAVGAVPDFQRYVSFCKQYPQDKPICAGLEKAESVIGTAKAKVYFAGVQSMFERWGNPHDSRVKAAFAMAPVAFVFDKSGLAPIHVPVFLYYGKDSHILPPKANALRIAPLIKTLAGIKGIPHARHFVFFGPCPPKLAKAVPRVCNVPPGVDRVKAYAQIDAAALSFFRSALVSSQS